MKLKIFLIATFLFMLSAAPLQAQVIVKERPSPPNSKQLISNPPSPHHVFIPPHWKWNKKRKEYVWTEGFWVKGKKGHTWKEGHWVETSDGWKWVEGHWKKH